MSKTIEISRELADQAALALQEEGRWDIADRITVILAASASASYIQGISFKISRGFDYIDGKHVPTLKISLDACDPDDNLAWLTRDYLAKDIENLFSAPAVERQEPVATLLLGEVFNGTNGLEVEDWDITWNHKAVDDLAVKNPGEHFDLYTSPPAPVPAWTTTDIATADADGFRNGRASVVMPTILSTEQSPHYSEVRASEYGYIAGWNACVDKFAELSK